MNRLAQKFTYTSSLIIFTALFLFALVAPYRFPDPDLFARMAMGRLIAESGSVPLTDPFAFTPKNEHWIDHEWLSGVVFYNLWSIGGEPLLFYFKFLSLILTVILTGFAAHLYDRSLKSPFLLISLFAAQYLWISTVRCQVFTYLMVPLLFVLLLTKQRRYLLLLPPLFCAWANLHGGFVMGLGLFFLFCLGETIRKNPHAKFLWSAWLASGLATGITPYGALQYWSFIFSAVSLSRSAIDEWAPLNLLTGEALVFNIVGISILSGILLSRTRLNVTSLLLMASSCLYGIMHFRLHGAFFIVCAIFGNSLAKESYTRILEKRPDFAKALRRSSLIVLFLASIVSLFSLVGSGRSLGKPQFDFHDYPVAALDYLKKNEQGGNVLINFNAGSYALWTLYPKFKISLDGRYEEVYPESTVDLVHQALTPGHPHHREALREINPDFIVIEIEHTSPYLVQFDLVHQDPRYSVLKARS